MLVQFGNNWIQKIPLTAKWDCSLVQFWLSSEFFSSNYFQIGQHVVLLHFLILYSWANYWALLITVLQYIAKLLHQETITQSCFRGSSQLVTLLINL